MDAEIKREYKKWYSPHVQKDMELLVFGHSGAPVLFFPTRTARFYDYEGWGVIDALRGKIAAGYIQLYCVDSIDYETFYCKYISPGERIKRHNQYEQYILSEVISHIKNNNPSQYIISVGCSLGAYHAVNIAFRYPHLFNKVIGLSGRYDLTLKMEHFGDLFDGYWDDNIYYNMPSQYMPNLTNGKIMEAIKRLDILFAVGVEDAFFDNNLHMSKCLAAKHIHHALYFWDGEAHKARHWSKMLQIYL